MIASPSEAAKHAYVLFIDALSRSLTDRPFMMNINGSALLSHWIQSFSHAECCDCRVVVADPIDHNVVRDLLTGFPCVILDYLNGDRLTALRRIIESTQPSSVAIVQLEYLLAPYLLVSKLTNGLAFQGADIGFVSDLPERVSPIVLTAHRVQQLCDGHFSSIGFDSDLLSSLLRRIGVGEASGSERRNVYSPAVTDLYRGPKPVLSRRVEFSRSIDYAVLRATLAKIPSSSGASPLDRLSTWHNEMVDCHQKDQPKFRSTCQFPSMTFPERAKARVLYVSNPSGYSGAEESLVQLVRALPKERIEVHTVVSRQGLFTEKLHAAGATVHCPNEDFARSTISNLTYLNALCHETMPDLIHLNAVSGFPILAIAELLRIPLVLHARNAFPDLYAEYVHAADAIIAVSNYVKRILLQLDIPSDKIHVVYDEVDPEYFVNKLPSAEARRLLGVPQSAKVVGCISRFAPNKQHALLLQACRLLRENVPRAHLLLKGEVFEDVAYANRIQILIDKFKLQDAITIVPFVEDIRTVYSASDVFTLCSRNEAFGRCVAEAMAMEIPVVVTSGGGASEIIEDGKSGLIVDHTPIALAQALTRMLTHDELRIACVSRARNLAVQMLDSRKSAETVADLYRKLLSGSVRQEAQAVA